jgi:hypothetical protein
MSHNTTETGDPKGVLLQHSAICATVTVTSMTFDQPHNMPMCTMTTKNVCLPRPPNPPPTPPGDPKGVLLKHSAICATVTSLKQFLEAGNFHLGPGDSTLSYLPLAHIFDRCVTCFVGRGRGGHRQWTCVCVWRMCVCVCVEDERGFEVPVSWDGAPAPWTFCKQSSHSIFAHTAISCSTS